ncbi:flavodoxin family protein [Ramlibacter sp. MMS24-I3-19]|uniref:flavodoxin family protein n=1 Tax=Ramlibacter sp. MMS24-I3-19 TaxID=3416606 RepID=UPI003CFCB35F
MSRVLVVCYSYTGTARRVAQLLCSHHGWSLGEVRDAGPRGTLRCVLDSLLRRHPAIRYEGAEPRAFDIVVLVAPIWMYRLAGPMRSFVAARRDQLPRVAVLATMSAGGATNAYAEVAQLLGHAPVACAAFLQREIEDGSATTRLLDLGDELDGAAVKPVAQPVRTAPA